MFKGIDVSVYQGAIDWKKVKPQIDFAILRCGYGDNIAKQDDSRFADNLAACEKLDIPYAVYLYSYAKTAVQIDSEIAHTLRLISGHKPFCVYIDMEEGSTLSCGKHTLTAFAARFCAGIESKGFKAGVYANENWFRNYLDTADLARAGFSIWCAKYSKNAPNIPAAYDIWQYASDGKVDGITGRVDMNIMVKDIAKIQPKRSVDELAREVLDGKWGNGTDRKTRLQAAGYDYAAVQVRVNALCEIERIAKQVIAGKWGNGAKRKAALSAAGYDYEAVQSAVNRLLR